MVKPSELCRLVVLISGNGTNLQAIIDACATRKFPAKVVAVVSNEPTAYGLQRARGVGIPTHVIKHHDFRRRTDFDNALKSLIDILDPDLVILAGFMRILGNDLTEHFLGRMMNIHPSLLPAFPGLHAQRQALEWGAQVSGCTVHFVDEQLDHGSIILQKAVPVLDDDTEETLAARILEQEHLIYPEALKLVCEDRFRVEERRVLRLKD